MTVREQIRKLRDRLEIEISEYKIRDIEKMINELETMEYKNNDNTTLLYKIGKYKNTHK